MTNASNPTPMGVPSNSKTLVEQPAPEDNSFISTIESLRLWFRYRYMFSNCRPRMEMNKGCFVLFKNLCQEIDEVLGEDKRGFEWTTIADEEGTPVWHWRLCKSLDLKLTAVVADQSLRVRLQHSVGDPQGQLRGSIALRVNAALAAARFMSNLLKSTGGAQ